MINFSPIAQQIWDMKYRLKNLDGTKVDQTIEDTWLRVARALTQVEQKSKQEYWTQRFYEAMEDFKFLPAGRILAGAGTDRHITLFNCFVMGTIPDSINGIFEHLREAALTMQQGGGIGYDFSSLRPKGFPVKGVGADASGPLSFMDVWDSMCRTIMSAGYRRGAMMATLRCDHPDIEDFIDAKHQAGRLRMFNLSVLVTDDFMKAVKQNQSWELKFNGITHKILPAKDLWDRIMRSTYAYAEPGVIFIDRINQQNNLYYCEQISSTNPCGEQPLPPYGACLLGSINLAALVKNPFQKNAQLNLEKLAELVTVAIRMMDNVIDISKFPLETQAKEAQAKRRLGLGITGLADAFIMCNVRYGSPNSVELMSNWLQIFQNAAYRASIDLAEEKGSFPLFNADKYCAGQTIKNLDQEIKDLINKKGIRNALVTSIAPTGTISLLANNVSSGLEPVFSFHYKRNILMPDGSRSSEEVYDYAYNLYQQLYGNQSSLPESFVNSQHLSPQDHLIIQATAQKYIDSSISKTINCPENLSFDDFKMVYQEAYDLGCKGCTTYRPNDVTGAVLEIDKDILNQNNGDKNQTELPLEKEIAKSYAQDEFEVSLPFLTKPLDRPEVLPGQTYKLRWPESDHAFYITINDSIENGQRRPFEIFVNSKNMSHHAWIVGLTRMISAIFRRGGDVRFIVEEMRAVFDPNGGAWLGGRYVPSLLAAIADIIEQHMRIIGFWIENMPKKQASDSKKTQSSLCPRCGEGHLIHQEGCTVCTSCGYSKCN
ncbi:MAG: adenosylcobalamin-dependent ribonucleoside-diphosphate reductase [Alphaproteobacteria bacterium]|nr:adenosylcobalamin-dependent ribonucleoside-diphosphate reductase [Alphaproteobacteria bacterium]